MPALRRRETVGAIENALTEGLTTDQKTRLRSPTQGIEKEKAKGKGKS